MKRNRWILSGVLLVLLVLVLMDRGTQEGWRSIFGGAGSEAAAGKNGQSLAAMAAAGAPKPGTPSPSFSLMGLDGKQYDVGGKRDKPLLLNFWASWCDPCKEEAPELVKLADKYKDSLDVYGVNVTFYDKLDDAKAFVKNYGYTFPVLLDEKEEVYSRFNGVAFPTNVLIDENGIIQDVILGVISPEELEAKIKQLL
ncbi:MAG: TlpA disulfide reductase family protein [Paenibacillus macerans]|uniref:Redoxin domain-containing protein n=1 Tax=Paenibacillus macerans TaxID=44252 RepID=A0A090YHV5_PAEMA|nr:TlpA disulfide reductase family protein [Paenibacillus macerans]KFM98398.1 thioredoxin family protein [Paenibacillus macerans]MBS5911208.1 TlpA family protein disulfide reductase [Paenibacillus macerans]MCY7562587.1 TlpA family protein disulfide reductase [Paenibacillus macerans]MDU5948263.1 TlpA disulfide reductase family protein [Paenibacillus macerans]MDU7472595.1 TlpA disulfide reductase family protein [Paenibacillus macerans]